MEDFSHPTGEEAIILEQLVEQILLNASTYNTIHKKRLILRTRNHALSLTTAAAMKYQLFDQCRCY